MSAPPVGDSPKGEKSPRAYQVEMFLAIPAYLSPKTERKVEKVGSNTTCEISPSLRNLRVNCPKYFFSGIEH
ncbi:MAG: hypothetical protein OXH00_25825 [Candidatus Poribacteria bacterium]|nr:hypothetical protein [Candidatus Poribacteria bacterium]